MVRYEKNSHNGFHYESIHHQNRTAGFRFGDLAPGDHARGRDFQPSARRDPTGNEFSKRLSP